MDDEMFLYAIASHFNLAIYSLKNVTLQDWVLELLPWPMIHQDLIVPFYLNEGVLTVLTPRPLDESTLEALAELTGFHIEQGLALETELRQALSRKKYQ